MGNEGCLQNLCTGWWCLPCTLRVPPPSGRFPERTDYPAQYIRTRGKAQAALRCHCRLLGLRSVTFIRLPFVHFNRLPPAFIALHHGAVVERDDRHVERIAPER